MLKEGMAVVYESAGAEYGPWGLDGLKQVEATARSVGRGEQLQSGADVLSQEISQGSMGGEEARAAWRLQEANEDRRRRPRRYSAEEGAEEQRRFRMVEGFDEWKVMLQSSRTIMIFTISCTFGATPVRLPRYDALLCPTVTPESRLTTQLHLSPSTGST